MQIPGRPGVDLVPLPDGRALISFERLTTIEELELTIAEALDDPGLASGDRVVFEAIRQILRIAQGSRTNSRFPIPPRSPPPSRRTLWDSV